MEPLHGTRVGLVDRAAFAIDRGALGQYGDGEAHCLIETGVIDAALFADQLWALVDRTGARWLERYQRSGALLGEPLDCAGATALVPARGTNPICLVVGGSAIELRDDCGELVQHAHADAPVAFLGARTWIGRRSGRLYVRRPAGDLAIELGAEHASAAVVSAALLLEGSAIAIELRGRSHALVVIGARRGDLWTRVRLDGISRVQFVEQAGHAIAIAGDGSVNVIDLVGRRPMRTLALPAPVDDVVVDPRGLVAAVHWRGEPGIWYRFEYADLVEARVTAAASSVASEAAVGEPAESHSRDPIETPMPVATVAAIVAASPLPDTVPVALGTRRPVRRLSILGHDAWSSALRDVVAAWCRRAVSLARGDERELREACGTEYRAELRWQTAGGESAYAPLGALATEFELGPLALRIVMAVATPRLWGEIAEEYRVFGRPNGPLCDELVLARLLGVEPRDVAELSRELDPGAPLVRHGVIAVAQDRRPFAELIVSRAIVERLRETVAERAAVPALDSLRLPREAVARLLEALAAPGPRVRVAIRGRSGSGRRTLAAALAARVDREIDVIDGMRTDVLRDRLLEAHHRGAIPCVTVPSGLTPEARSALLLALEGHPGAVLLRAAVDVDLPYEAAQHVLELPSLDEHERGQIWTERLVAAGHPASLADALAARYVIGAGMIHRVAGVALAGPDPAQIPARVHDELRQRRDAAVRGVASRVTNLASWSQLVLPPDVIESLREFSGRVRHRRTVMERWGFDRVITSSRGLTALFQGAPGTGKTLVAGAIARELGYDLYRVDLSRVMSKWIGETERNLAGVFDAAEQGDVILLFDEADSLFARRTEVKTSNDRFANLEVNYLLQRLDAFEGFAILTTNFGTSIDPAFKRRLTLRLTFPFPDPETRRELWRVHLPEQLPVEGDLRLERLSERFAVTGGYIRNAVLRAAYLAAQEDAALTHDRLERAMLLEYREMGKLAASGSLE